MKSLLREVGAMEDLDPFLASTMPRLTAAETALHNGDASPKIPIVVVPSMGRLELVQELAIRSALSVESGDGCSS